MAAAAPTTDHVGKYKLLEPLGRGGMAVVYRARDQATGGLVALKTALQVKESSLSSIRREVEALRRLRHPGIVRILESGVDAGRPWYAMEILAGPTLAWALMGEPVDPAVELERLASKRGFRDVFAALLDEGVARREIQPLDARTVAAAIVGAMQEALLGPLADPEDNHDPLVGSLISFVLHAVQAKELQV